MNLPLNSTMTIRHAAVPSVESVKGMARDAIYIVSGCLVFIWGMSAVMIPEGLFGGGLTGVAILLKYFFPGVDVGTAYFALNLPLLVLGLRTNSRYFIGLTAFGMTVFAVAADLWTPPALGLNDPFLAAITAGVFCGVGSGLILRSRGSAGGLDILAIYLNRRWGLRIGQVGFACNTAIILAGAWLYDLRMALYSVVLLFVSSKVIDAVIAGFNVRKSVMVVSSHYQAIAKDIMEGMNRGVTLFDGAGAFTQEPKKIIFTVTTLTEVAKLKARILTLDPEAFIVINDTLEVYGRRLGRYAH